MNPKSLPKEWQKYLPFSAKYPSVVQQSIESLKKKLPLPKQFKPLVDTIVSKGQATDGGKLIYAIKRTVAEAMNHNDAIPEFADTVLQLLEMNFIQQYADYSGGELTFATQWPAKLDGIISIENKSSAVDPTSGGFSFKLGRVDDSVSDEPGQPDVDGLDVEPEPNLKDVAQDIVNPSRKTKPEPVTSLGREKRK